MLKSETARHSVFEAVTVRLQSSRNTALLKSQRFRQSYLPQTNAARVASACDRANRELLPLAQGASRVPTNPEQPFQNRSAPSPHQRPAFQKSPSFCKHFGGGPILYLRCLRGSFRKRRDR